MNELRSLFTAGPQLADRIRDFRLDRIAKIAAGQSPVQLMDRGLLVIQVVPLSAFDIAATLPLHQISQGFGIFAPIGSRSASGVRINFDGVLKTSNADQAATQHRAYVQLFRTGIVEAVTSTIISNSNGAPIIFNIDDQIIGEAVRKLNDLAAISVEPPYALLVSLIGVKGARFNLARGANAAWYDNLGDTLDRDQYHFAEIIFELVPKTPDECAAIVRPILDEIANAGGAASSPTYDQQGNYISPRRQ